ncbi:AAA family ATPase, partial [Streptomyces prasinus]|uniref:AAA family ATPase n=1 Tax=Streptomyces prasinus TaxID=67345 RepID=UPI0036344DC6
MSSTARYTTQDILDAEETVRAQALERFDGGAVQLTADQAATAVDVFQVAAGFDLSEEQQAAVTRVLTAGHGIDALVGVAGAGKSTLMEACRIGWDATGTTYAGATLAAVAAKQLTDASGIPAKTVAAWLGKIENGNGLRGGGGRGGARLHSVTRGAPAGPRPPPTESGPRGFRAQRDRLGLLCAE